MDGRDKQRFTRNWSALKERVGGDLDRILDRLLEENIFDVETKDFIDNVHPTTLQNKVDNLLRKLVRKQAYPVFICILQEIGGYDDLVDKMENTNPDKAQMTNRESGIPHILYQKDFTVTEPNQEDKEQTQRKIAFMNDEDCANFQVDEPDNLTNAATAQAVISPEMIKTFIAEQVGIQFKLMNEKMTALVDEGVDRKVEKKVEEMKAELRTLKADLKAAKNKAKSLRKINVNLTKDNKTMQCKIAQKDKKIETLKNRINTLEAELNKQKHATGSDFKEAKAKFSLVKWLQVKFSKQAPENTEIIYRPTI